MNFVFWLNVGSAIVNAALAMVVSHPAISLGIAVSNVAAALLVTEAA